MKTLSKIQIVLDIVSFLLFLFVAIWRQDFGYGIATIWVVIATMAHFQLLKYKNY